MKIYGLPLLLITPVVHASDLEREVARRLPALGHRNWIVIADAAYPLQTSPGIETITVKDSQVEAVRQVLIALSKTKHVRPVVFLDSELKFVAEKNAPGIDAYRASLNQVLQGRPAQRMLHEKIIANLDEAGKSFKVLLIKTPHTLPYTSIFLQLQCGYWSDAAEKELRNAMKAGAK
jgi:D-ribose pyranose/furanose isomerase RbsD